MVHVTTEGLWQIVADARDGILATIGVDGTPQLSNIYYLCDPSTDASGSRPRPSGSRRPQPAAGPPGGDPRPGPGLLQLRRRGRTRLVGGRRRSPTTPPSRSCSRSTPGWERHRNRTTASRCWPTTGWQSSSTSNASTGRSSTDDGAQGQTTSREGDAVSDEADMEQLRRDVQYLMDRTAILDCISSHRRGHDRHDAELLTNAYHPDGSDEHGKAINPGPSYAAWINPVHAAGSGSTPTTSRRIPARSTATRRTARATSWYACSTTTG